MLLKGFIEEFSHIEKVKLYPFELLSLVLNPLALQLERPLEVSCNLVPFAVFGELFALSLKARKFRDRVLMEHHILCSLLEDEVLKMQ